jgi:hypothetical protein
LALVPQHAPRGALQQILFRFAPELQMAPKGPPPRHKQLARSANDLATGWTR